MNKRIRIRSVRKQEVDTNQLAVAFLLLAKILHEREQANQTDRDYSERAPRARDDPGRAA